MRYYVLRDGDNDEIDPYIVAELVRTDLTDDEGRSMVASFLAGERAIAVTHDDLIAHPLGEAALAAWDAKDDARHDSDVRPSREHPGGSHRRGLRLVRTE